MVDEQFNIWMELVGYIICWCDSRTIIKLQILRRGATHVIMILWIFFYGMATTSEEGIRNVEDPLDSTEDDDFIDTPTKNDGITPLTDNIDDHEAHVWRANRISTSVRRAKREPTEL